MGIVLNQSFKNTVILILGFAIGGINTLFLYTNFLEEEYYGLVIFVLSTANILLPFIAFGMQHSVVKYFSSYKDKSHKDSLLTWSLLLPLIVVVPFGFIGMYGYETVSNYISKENILIKEFTYLIFLCAVFMGYFEVFYAWTKVQLNSVFGNFVREVFVRICVSILLFAIFFNWISPTQFIYGITIAYFLRMIIMMLYALKLYTPEFTLKRPINLNEIIRYSLYLVISGSAATILLDIDKFMIPQTENIAKVAYYSVGIYIASVVAIPNRAMQQITHPIVATYLNNKNMEGVRKLYKQSSINLLIVGGLLFLLINLNIVDLYKIIDKPEYSVGVLIVLLVSISELFKLVLGINGSILTNSKYYQIFFYLSVGTALTAIILNKVLIKKMGIDGAALATLVTIVFFAIIKIWYVKRKLKIQPFTRKTFIVLMLILLMFKVFYSVDFNLHPILNIAFKSILISLIYGMLIYRLKLSADINELVDGYLKK